MSIELHVLMSDSKVPNRDQWQHAISEAGFDLTLDATFQPQVNTGFVVTRYKGMRTGFEFDLFPASDILDTYQEMASRAGELDVSANFRFGGDTNELVAAVIAASVLAQITGGVLFDPQDGTMVEGEGALALANRTIRDLAK